MQNVRCALQDFDGAWIFSTDFCKILKCQIWWKSFNGSRFVSCGLTDMTTRAVAFHNFANALKIYHSCSPHKLLTFPGTEGFLTFCNHLLQEDKWTSIALLIHVADFTYIYIYIYIYLSLILLVSTCRKISILLWFKIFLLMNLLNFPISTSITAVLKTLINFLQGNCLFVLWQTVAFVFGLPTFVTCCEYE